MHRFHEPFHASAYTLCTSRCHGCGDALPTSSATRAATTPRAMCKPEILIDAARGRDLVHRTLRGEVLTPTSPEPAR